MPQALYARRGVTPPAAVSIEPSRQRQRPKWQVLVVVTLMVLLSIALLAPLARLHLVGGHGKAVLTHGLPPPQGPSAADRRPAPVRSAAAVPVTAPGATAVAAAPAIVATAAAEQAPPAPPPMTLEQALASMHRRRSSQRTSLYLLQHHHLFRPDQLGRAELEPCAAPTAPGELEFAPGSWTGNSTEGGWTLPLTHEAQRAIWEHQNPKDCASAKFLAVPARESGIGSILHILAVVLAVAVETGRVLVESYTPPYNRITGGFLAVGEPACGNATTIERCYFLPFSHCQLGEEDYKNATQGLELAFVPNQGDARVVHMVHPIIGNAERTLVPSRFRSKLAATALQPEKHYYWWRAQAVAYMVRPNARVLQDLDARTRRTLVGPAPQPGCISVHVRHGDKGVEADVFADGMYYCAMSELRALFPNATTGQVFLSTEDPDTVSYFKAHLDWWALSYTDVPRKPNTHVANVEYMTAIGWWEEMVNSLMNLDLALRCSAWVGAINSNWVRLIDELRSTVRCKAHLPYADVQYDDPHAMDLNW